MALLFICDLPKGTPYMGQSQTFRSRLRHNWIPSTLNFSMVYTSLGSLSLKRCFIRGKCEGGFSAVSPPQANGHLVLHSI